MRIVSIEEMKEIDRKSINDYKIPAILLMEHAGINLYKYIESKYDIKTKHFLIVCGVGNNGGDGLVLARLLLQHQASVDIIILGDIEKATECFDINYNILKSSGISFHYIKSSDDILEHFNLFQKSNIIIDAIFGLGLSRKVSGIYKDIIQIINQSKAKKLCIDIPSGLQFVADDGLSVKATRTLTIGLPKDIFFKYPYVKFVDKIHIIDSIFPKCLLEDNSINDSFSLLNQDKIDSITFSEDKFNDKFSQGSLGIIAGSDTFAGAGIMSTMAAYRLGVGYINLFVPQGIKNIISNRLPNEIVVTGIGTSDSLYFEKTGNYESALGKMKKCSTLLIGPGLARENKTYDFFTDIIKNVESPLVLDADALYFLSLNKDIIKSYENEIIITPHIFEFSKLNGKSVKDIKRNPFNSVNSFYDKLKVNILLKDALSYIKTKESSCVHYHPNYGMGKAGMGDVLAGVLGAFLSRRFTPIDTMTLGVYLQYLSFMEAKNKIGADGVQPSDLYDIIPSIYKDIKKITR